MNTLRRLGLGAGLGLSSLCLSGLFASTVLAQPAPMLGFSPAAAQSEAALEQRFDAQLDKADLKTWMERLASAP
jgi:hypothetical protein